MAWVSRAAVRDGGVLVVEAGAGGEAEPAFRTYRHHQGHHGLGDRPNADVLWESVSTTINAEGTTEKQPRTDEDWKTVRRSAVALVEATNLLVMDGRKMAPAGRQVREPRHRAGARADAEADGRRPRELGEVRARAARRGDGWR